MACENQEICGGPCSKAKKEICHYYRPSAASAGYLSVPAIPEPACLDSMCMRYDHGFGIKRLNTWVNPIREETDEEFERRRESTRSTMRQLYEEATGQGFFKK